MGRTPQTVQQVMSALDALAFARDTPSELTRLFRRALLDFGSDTPDNVAALTTTEVVEHNSGRGDEIALTTNPTGHAFDEIAYALEDLDLPDGLKQRLPDLSEQDWEAFTRVTTLLYLALRSRPTGPQMD